MAAPSGRILVVGSGDPAGAHELVWAIRQHSPAPQQQQQQQREAQQACDSYTWRIDNRYYTADVEFEVQQVDQAAGLQLPDGAYEAVILLIDASTQHSFTSLQRWWEAAAGGEADLGVRLAVVGRGLAAPPHAHDGAPARPAWLTEAEEWCAEQLVEYVEVEACDEAAVEAAAEAAAAAAASAGSEGPTGLQRIREALHAHMWPGMHLKPSPRRGAAAVVPESDGEAEEDATPAAAANGVHPTHLANGSSSGADAGPEAFSFGDYLQAPADAPADAATAPARAGGQRAAGGTGGVGADPGLGATAAAGDGLQEEEEVEQLEQLFAQVASHRAQLAQMPDAQRREAAAAMVMQLMAAMGLEEGEDDEEEE